MNLPPFPNTPDFALFLDFDGTLVEIADHPDLVQLASSTRHALEVLHQHLDGALAIITGREIEDIDHFAAPLKLPVAGIHGAVIRAAAGRKQSELDVSAAIDAIAARLAPLVDSEKGLMLEKKQAALALHYRARPELASKCLTAFEAALSIAPELELKRGKMVLEAKPNGRDKGTAVLDFLSEPPFLGRTPWFAGDDVTDEDAFAAVNHLGGTTIKVGDGATVATYRAESTLSFRTWLEALAHSLTTEIKS